MKIDICVIGNKWDLFFPLWDELEEELVFFPRDFYLAWYADDSFFYVDMVELGEVPYFFMSAE